MIGKVAGTGEEGIVGRGMIKGVGGPDLRDPGTEIMTDLVEMGWEGRFRR